MTGKAEEASTNVGCKAGCVAAEMPKKETEEASRDEDSTEVSCSYASRGTRLALNLLIPPLTLWTKCPCGHDFFVGSL